MQSSNQSIATLKILKQQNQQLSYTLQIKQKKITYLQSQLKSTKLELLQKLELIENSFNQLKKENHTLTRKFMDQKRQDNFFYQQNLKKTHQDYNLQLNEKQKFYQKLLNEKQQKSQSKIKDIQTRYEDILKKIKQQNKTLQNLLTAKNSRALENQSQNFTFGDQQFRYFSLSQEINSQSCESQCIYESNPVKQKMSMMKQIIQYKQKYQKIKKQLQISKQSNLKNENQTENTVAQYEEKIKILSRSIQSLNIKIVSLNEQKLTEQNIYLEKIFELEQIKEKYKIHFKEMDQNYLKILSNKTENLQNKKIPVNTIRTCNHQGLIYQLERNLAIKNQQINELKNRMKQWQKMLGFSKNFNQRLHEISNVTDRTEKIYKNQKQRIKKQVESINSKR